MNSKELKKGIEVLLFASSEPLSIISLKRALKIEKTNIIEEALNELIEEYNSLKGIYIEKVQGGYQIFTKPEYDYLVKTLMNEERKYNISRAALEVLAISAVFQPVTKPEIESIRGISSDGVIKHLVDIELLKIAGRLRTPGRPLLYSTTPEFLKYFHLADNEDLKDLHKKFSKKFEQNETN
ncbi:SMC-Scp complex subunit ScpB [candidate division WOR-3 bacterium]|nr:SMC-Scp complex subunit ScpB [candidate division WOR-3 bacterium]